MFVDYNNAIYANKYMWRNNQVICEIKGYYWGEQGKLGKLT